MKNILIVSYEDSCRSRIAQAMLNDFGRGMNVLTAGVVDGAVVPSLVVSVMSERGYEVSTKKSITLDHYVDQNIDFVITLCEEALDLVKEINLVCPSKRAHLLFENPLYEHQSDENRCKALGALCDEMYRSLYRFYRNTLSDLLLPSCTCGANTYCRCE